MTCIVCTTTIQLNDWGTELLFPITECKLVNGVLTRLAVDLTNATGIEIRFLREDNTVLTVVGIIYTEDEFTPEDGIIQYITIEGDANVIGKWQVQATITFPTGEFNTDVDATIKVLDNI